MNNNINTLAIFIEQVLGEYKRCIDSDAAVYLATKWSKLYRNFDKLTKMTKLIEYLEILADYDCDTENGKIDRKTVEIFIEDEIQKPNSEYY